MKYRFIHHSTIAQMLDDYSLKKLGRDTAIPNAFGVHDDYRSASAHAKAWCFTPLHTSWAEQQVLALEQPCKEAVKRSAATIGRAKPAGAHEHVPAVGLHLRRANEDVRHGATSLTRRDP